MGLFNFNKKNTASELPPMPVPTGETQSATDSSMPPMPNLPDLPSGIEQPPMPNQNSFEQSMPEPSVPETSIQQQNPLEDNLPSFDIPKSTEEFNSTQEEIKEPLPEAPEETTSVDTNQPSEEESEEKSDNNIPDFDLNTIPDLDSLELPTFPEIEPFEEENILEETDEIYTPTSQVYKETPKTEIEHETIISRTENISGPRFIKVDVYTKIHEVINRAEEDLNDIIKDGNQIIAIDAEKAKDITSIKSNINKITKKLYKMEELVFNN